MIELVGYWSENKEKVWDFFVDFGGYHGILVVASQ